jgi:hypothetical protein
MGNAFVEGLTPLGDTLVLYTDGMTESFNDSGEEFGRASPDRGAKAASRKVIVRVEPPNFVEK